MDLRNHLGTAHEDSRAPLGPGEQMGKAAVSILDIVKFSCSEVACVGGWSCCCLELEISRADPFFSE